jgi:hypothetical protein
MSTVTTSGDAGDSIYTLAILQEMSGGPHQYLIEEKDELTATGRTTEGPRVLLGLIHDLAVSQPYISECRLLQSTDTPMWRSGGFRMAGLHNRQATLMSAHLAHLNIRTGMGLQCDGSKQWLHGIEPSILTKGRVVVNRTQRYRNQYFPWAEIVAHYGKLISFVGLPHEHAIFVNDFGYVDFRPTKTLLEVAQLIAGSSLFIGNQSCAFAVAEGLKHPSIQETSLSIPDCIFKRPNVQHVWTGACELPAVGDMPSKKIPQRSVNIGLVSENITPPEPWHWSYDGIAPQMTIYAAVEILRSTPEFRGRPEQEIKDALKHRALENFPEHYRPSREGENVKAALRFAGYQL